jgi:hypothetical protein
MPENDHLDIFKAAVQAELAGAPGPQSVRHIALPDDHPLAKALLGMMAGAMTAGAAPGPGDKPALDFRGLAPDCALAIRNTVRRGRADGTLSDRRAAGLDHLAACLEEMPGADWLPATIVQLAAIWMADGDETDCFDGFTAAWFRGHIPQMNAAVARMRSMATAERAAVEEEARPRGLLGRLIGWLKRTH